MRQNNSFQFEGDLFIENAQVTGKILYKVFFSWKNLQTKSQVKSMNIRYYQLYCTVIKIFSDDVGENWDLRLFNSWFLFYKNRETVEKI